MDSKPTLSLRQIWNMNIGFLGLQLAFSVVMTNTSRIFSAVGADTDLLSMLWLAPPLAGLIVQPIVGYYSDKRWTRFGRRIPFVFVGSVVSFLLLILLPNYSFAGSLSATIWGEVVLLFVLQCMFNMTMLPFRSLIGDRLNRQQQNTGFSVQTCISNVGSILGSLFPFILAFVGIRNEASLSQKLAPTLSYSFYIGAIVLLLSVLWTCIKTKELKPELSCKDGKNSSISLIVGSRVKGYYKTFFELAFIQFFSWMGFFFVWVYATDAMASKVWHCSDPLSEGYNEAGNWFGVLSGVYSGVSIVTTFFLARLANRFGRKRVYFVALVFCSLGFSSFYLISNQYLLLLPMIGIGIGWASILTFPFAIMGSKAPKDRMGWLMGLLNVTITIPQIVGAMLGGVLFKYLAKSDSMTMILFGGLSLFLAALFVLRLEKGVNVDNSNC